MSDPILQLCRDLLRAHKIHCSLTYEKVKNNPKLKRKKRKIYKRIDRLEKRDFFLGWVYFIPYPSVSYDAWAMNEGKEWISSMKKELDEVMERDIND